MTMRAIDEKRRTIERQLRQEAQNQTAMQQMQNILASANATRVNRFDVKV